MSGSGGSSVAGRGGTAGTGAGGDGAGETGAGGNGAGGSGAGGSTGGSVGIGGSGGVGGSSGVGGGGIGGSPIVIENPEPSLAVEPQSVLGVASRPGEYLVAFHEGRSGFQDASAYVTRVAADGTVIDPAGIRIGEGVVSVAADDGQYFAAWTECPVTGCRVRVARLAPSATGIAQDTVTAATGAGLTDAKIVRVGSRFAVMWNEGQTMGGSGGDGGAPPPVTTRLVAFDATQWPPPPATMLPLKGGFWQVAGGPNGALLGISDNGKAAVVKLSLTPSPALSTPIEVPITSAFATDVAAGGGQFLLTWQAGGGLVAARFDADVSPVGAPITLAAGGLESGPFSLRAGWDGTAFHVARRTGAQLTDWAVSQQGDVTMSSPVGGASYQRVWASQGTGAAVFGTDEVGRIQYSPTPQNDASFVPLTRHSSEQKNPSLSTAGGWLAWVDAKDDQRRVKVAGPVGAPDGSTAFVRTLENVPFTTFGFHPSVATGPSGGAVAWLSGDQVFGARLGTDGTLLDSAPVLVASTADYLDMVRIVASEGGYSVMYSATAQSVCLVDLPATGSAKPRGCIDGFGAGITNVDGALVLGWSVYDVATSSTVLVAQRVAPGEPFTTTPIGTGGATSGLTKIADLGGSPPRLASNGKQVIAVWTKVVPGLPQTVTPWAVVFDAATLLPLAPPFALSDDKDAGDVDAAFDGQSFRVVWQIAGNTGVRTATVTTAGQKSGSATPPLMGTSAWLGVTIAETPSGLLFGHAPLDVAGGAVRLELRHLAP